MLFRHTIAVLVQKSRLSGCMGVYGTICRLEYRKSSMCAFYSVEKVRGLFWNYCRVVLSAQGDGGGHEAEARRIFLLSCDNQQCDERAIPNTTGFKTHRAQW